MKLYEVPRNADIKIVDCEEQFRNMVFRFDHLDGMYSVCYTELGELCHLYAGTEVEIVEKVEHVS